MLRLIVYQEKKYYHVQKIIINYIKLLIYFTFNFFLNKEKVKKGENG